MNTIKLLVDNTCPKILPWSKDLTSKSIMQNQLYLITVRKKAWVEGKGPTMGNYHYTHLSQWLSIGQACLGRQNISLIFCVLIISSNAKKMSKLAFSTQIFLCINFAHKFRNLCERKDSKRRMRWTTAGEEEESEAVEMCIVPKRK